jgi:hypothetical protein
MRPRTTGLVIGATDPLDDMLRLGNRNRGWVRVITDLDGNAGSCRATLGTTDSDEV